MSHNFIVLAIFLPKIIKISENMHCICTWTFLNDVLSSIM